MVRKNEMLIGVPTFGEEQKNERKKKKMEFAKKIIVITVIVIVVLVIQIKLTITIQNGTFAEGNKDQYSVANTKPKADNTLKGKTIIFLGSSVTAGASAKGSLS